jgi:hypothetical protein
MKTFVRLLIFLTAGQLMMTSIAQAATMPASLAPANTFIYVEGDTTKNNPLKGQLTGLINSLIDTAPSSETQAVMEIIANNIENTTAGFSQSFHQTDGSEIFSLSIALPESDFQTVLANLPGLTEKNLGQNHMVYSTGTDFFFSYKNGNLIASSREGILSDLLLQSDPTSLQQNPDWQFLQSKSSPESFLKMFINLEKIPAVDVNGVKQDLSSLTNLLKSEGITVDQTAYGLNALITVKPGTELTLSPEKLSFYPELFKKVSAQNILLYSESFNWNENLKSSIGLLNQLQAASGQSDMEAFQLGINELTTAFTQATGLDLETDLAPLFQNRTAFAMHAEADQQYVPAFTLISEVKGQETKANTVTKTLRDKLLESMESSFSDSYDQEVVYQNEMAEFYKDDPTYKPETLPAKEDLIKRFYSTSTVTVNNTTYNQITKGTLTKLTRKWLSTFPHQSPATD